MLRSSGAAGRLPHIRTKPSTIRRRAAASLWVDRAFCRVTMLLQSAPKAFGVGPTASPRRVRPAADKMAVLRLRARRSSSFHALMGWALDTIR